ncbi:glycoside hydrolase family 65 protein [Levilactobacillus brevis]|nr:glycosyl hydrolase family 65 protein [Levilactobacillus brevis]MCZ2118979.1 glycoside hydrolase family 65 protein [Levilactobacillus brevis]MCZ2124380.1 glycoside hydrolase family 65 protein [Levilactobacillus brevis]MCZ2208786.1 glycoside hydrolase family 65 protein [Levilactobacillus brevis]
MLTLQDYHLTLHDVANHQPAYLETVFSLANGHFGVRANDPITGNPIAGTLINGFYETAPITYGEAGVGYAKAHQTILNLPDFRHINVATTTGHSFTSSERTKVDLDLATGELTEHYTLQTRQGETIAMSVQSVIGQTQTAFWAVNYGFLAGNYAGGLVVNKTIAVPAEAESLPSADPRKTRLAGLPICETTFMAKDLQQYHVKTRQTKQSVTIYLGMLTTPGSLLRQPVDLGDHTTHHLSYEVYVGEMGQQNTIDPALPFPATALTALMTDSRDFWQDVWQRSEVTVGGNDELDLAIHYNLFQLNQAAGRDGRTNIAAKGLSGSGYEGHYFWDTEMYMLPYFIYTNQPMARQLLVYRYQTLPQARQRARALGVDQGALFAWRTINGEEASAYFPAGTAQYHIDADIAYAVGKYYEITRDIDFIKQCGFEMVLETAHFWEAFGSWHQVGTSQRFEFHTVTGPDEYTALVNNNYYTNRLAKHNFELVTYLAQEILKVDPNGLTKFGIDATDIDAFQNLAEHVYLPYSAEQQINAQDDSFLSKPRWPVAQSTPENFPLLLHYHPLTIYRYQVAKQADTLLADYLFPEDLSPEQLQREYHYYEGVTTHDSSLSRSIFSILAARMGDVEKGYRYFMDTAQMDLVNLQKNTADGLHLANLGGSWLALVAGFSEFYVQDEVVHFTNHLPSELTQLTYRMKIAESVLEIKLTATETTVVVISGPIPTYGVSVNGQLISLAKKVR